MVVALNWKSKKQNGKISLSGYWLDDIVRPRRLMVKAHLISWNDQCVLAFIQSLDLAIKIHIKVQRKEFTISYHGTQYVMIELQFIKIICEYKTSIKCSFEEHKKSISFINYCPFFTMFICGITIIFNIWSADHVVT